MRILIDMNLSPEWVNEFRLYDINAIHWSNIGDIGAPDVEIMDWARKNEYIVFTFYTGAWLVLKGGSSYITGKLAPIGKPGEVMCAGNHISG